MAENEITFEINYSIQKAIKGVNELKKANEELAISAEQASKAFASSNANSNVQRTKTVLKEEKGLIEDIEHELKRLEEAKRKAHDTKDIERYNKKIQEAKRDLNEYNNTGLKKTNEHAIAGQHIFKELGTMIAGAFAVEKVFEFAKASFEAYEGALKSERRLLNATEGREIMQRQLLETAKEMQEKYAIPHEAIEGTMQFFALQGQTEKQIKKSTEAAIQLSAATGIDLQSAQMQISGTFEGVIGRMGRLDDRFKKLTKEQLENGAAVDLILEKYKGVAEASVLATDKTKIQVSEFKEGFGKVIYENIDNVFESMSEMGMEADKLGESLGENIVDKIKQMIVIVPGAFDLISGLFTDFEGTIEKVGENTIETFESIGEWGSKIAEGDIGGALNDVKEGVMGLVGTEEEVKDYTLTINELFKGFVEGSEQAVKKVENLNLSLQYLIRAGIVTEQAASDARVQFYLKAAREKEKLEAEQKAKEQSKENGNKKEVKDKREQDLKDQQEYELALYKLTEKDELKIEQFILNQQKEFAEKKHEWKLLNDTQFATLELQNILKQKELINKIEEREWKKSLQDEKERERAEAEAKALSIPVLMESNRQKIVDGYNKLLLQVEKDVRKVDILDYLFPNIGEGGELMSDEQKEAIKKSLSTIVDSFKDFLNQYYEVDLEMAKKITETANERIKAKDEELKAEQELQKEGLANNVLMRELELEKLTEQRNKALAEEEKIKKKQRQLETLEQTGALITASANIWKSNSILGPLAPVLSIATIAAMWASFIASKAKAKELTKFEHGGHGILGGERHAFGGTYIDGIGEGEKGEYFGIISRPMTAKYKPILPLIFDSLNKGLFPDGKDVNVNSSVSLDESKQLEAIRLLLANKQSNYIDCGKYYIERIGNTERKFYK